MAAAKFYLITRGEYVWRVAVVNGKTYWLYIQGRRGDCLRSYPALAKHGAATEATVTR